MKLIKETGAPGLDKATISADHPANPQFSLNSETLSGNRNPNFSIDAASAVLITEHCLASGMLARLPNNQLVILVKALAPDEHSQNILINDLKHRELNRTPSLKPVFKIAELASENPCVFADLVTSGTINSGRQSDSDYNQVQKLRAKAALGFSQIKITRLTVQLQSMLNMGAGTEALKIVNDKLVLEYNRMKSLS